MDRTVDLSDFMDEISADYQFVIFDVHGSANQELAQAISREDLVTMPMRAKTADAEVAADAIGLLNSQQNSSAERSHTVWFHRDKSGNHD